jgi:hypothetical protein
MAKKRNKPATQEAAKPKVQKEDPTVVFEGWLKSCTETQRQTVFEVDARLTVIQKAKADLKRELQPLRVGMELSRVKEVIVGRTGRANPQQESGRIWGAYRDSHLKWAGYTKSSCDTYVAMIEEARKILPDDKLITALLDHTNERGAVVMTGGRRERPFGKYSMYLKSEDVQQHVDDGKVNLDDLSAEDLVANVFDPENVETPETKVNMTVAVNSVVNKIFSELKANVLPARNAQNPLVDEAQAIKHSHKLVQYVAESLLTACACEPMNFKARSLEHLKDDEIITLASLVQAANDKKKKVADSKPAKKKANKTKSTHVREYEQPETVEETEIRPEGGKHIIRKNPKPQYPQTPWEIFEDGKDKPVARCQDASQAVTEVIRLQSKEVTAAVKSPAPTDAYVTQTQDDAIRKQQDANRKQHDAE